MRMPRTRGRRARYALGASACLTAGGVLALLWPSEGRFPTADGDPAEEAPAAASASVASTASAPRAAPPARPRAATPGLKGDEAASAEREVARTASVAAPKLPLVEGAGEGDGSELEPYQGYLVVRTERRVDLFIGQTRRGATNRRLVFRCGEVRFHLRDPVTDRWLAWEQPVDVACQDVTTVVAPLPPPAPLRSRSQ